MEFFKYELHTSPIKRFQSWFWYYNLKNYTYMLALSRQGESLARVRNEFHSLSSRSRFSTFTVTYNYLSYFSSFNWVFEFEIRDTSNKNYFVKFNEFLRMHIHTISNSRIWQGNILLTTFIINNILKARFVSRFIILLTINKIDFSFNLILKC